METLDIKPPAIRLDALTPMELFALGLRVVFPTAKALRRARLVERVAVPALDGDAND